MDNRISFQIGEGRTEVQLEVNVIGEDYLVTITGGKEHIGAVGTGAFHEESGRGYSSVIAFPGHKDDRLAKKSSEEIAKKVKKNVVVVSGFHLENITPSEIDKVMKNTKKAVSRFISFIES
ncbi:hypothetical protein AKJ39_02060 [candidate division MSBL1 archaeon SCGC-AAA259J03]|uniref:Prenylated flavin chaperone LpdD-like domain-containing protein n=1 Tax=candidate division MSBL1 archaeon SCGC-AAA259J03 TaxID=1698269 RepID=A0A656YWJ1_9EURY|nr:hypothetical protein AKJ39_02060 [candidate division MSBL1 archaeon SCGC-AAA259J03]